MSVITRLMHFLPQPCRSRSGYAPTLHVDFAYPNKYALFISEKTVTVNLSTRAFLFF